LQIQSLLYNTAPFALIINKIPIIITITVDTLAKVHTEGPCPLIPEYMSKIPAMYPNVHKGHRWLNIVTERISKPSWYVKNIIPIANRDLSSISILSPLN